MVGDGRQPNSVGGSIPSLRRFPIKGSMTITLAPCNSICGAWCLGPNGATLGGSSQLVSG